MSKAVILLSGCGVRDGSEIHESVLCLLALDTLGIAIQYTAPDVEQAKSFDHFHQKAEQNPRNALVEAARIARCAITPTNEMLQNDADMLVIPGGLGAATTLCNYAENKEKATVLPEVKELILSFYKQKKPIVATCVAPALLALSLQGTTSATLTLGTNTSDLEFLKNVGMVPKPCSSNDFVVDTTNKIVTTPAYMEKTSIAHMYTGIEGAIAAALQFLKRD